MERSSTTKSRIKLDIYIQGNGYSFNNTEMFHYQIILFPKKFIVVKNFFFFCNQLYLIIFFFVRRLIARTNYFNRPRKINSFKISSNRAWWRRRNRIQRIRNSYTIHPLLLLPFFFLRSHSRILGRFHDRGIYATTFIYSCFNYLPVLPPL